MNDLTVNQLTIIESALIEYERILCRELANSQYDTRQDTKQDLDDCRILKRRISDTIENLVSELD